MPLIRTGADNGGADKKALFLKQYAGEVMASYNAKNLMEQYHKVKNVDAGKEFQFPVIGRASASYWAVGTELTGQNIAQSERVITLDDLLYHDLFIPEIDELMDHVSKRQEYTRQQGEALANAFDKNVLRQAILAARAGATITGQEAGTSIISATAATSATALSTALHLVAQTFDEKFVAPEGRRVFLKPAQYYLMVKDLPDLVNRNYGNTGSTASAMLPRVADMEIIKSVNLPATDQTADGTIQAKYRANYSTNVCAILTPEAIGTVRRMGITSEMAYKTEFQATHVVAKMLVGHGILRPEGAAEIKTA
jgi:hypothetical protein